MTNTFPDKKWSAMLVHGVMGHASKQMIYEVYGKYTGGLGRDKLGVLQNFGRDSKQRAKGKESPGRMRKFLREPGL